MDLKLTDKTALVTGATAGIGLEIARTLALEGAAVTITGRSRDKLDSAIADIGAAGGTPVTGIVADVATAEGVAALTAALPQVDILINNLGIYESKAFGAISDADWSRLFEVNVMSGVRLSRAYLPRHARRRLGADHLHLERIRDRDTGGHDPLRHHQNGTAFDRTRPRSTDARHKGNRQFGPARADPVRRDRGVPAQPGKRSGRADGADRG